MDSTLPAAPGQLDAVETAVKRFELRVEWAVSDAYVELAALGLSDGQIVDLLGLPAGMRYPADKPVSEAA